LWWGCGCPGEGLQHPEALAHPLWCNRLAAGCGATSAQSMHEPAPSIEPVVCSVFPGKGEGVGLHVPCTMYHVPCTMYPLCPYVPCPHIPCPISHVPCPMSLCDNVPMSLMPQCPIVLCYVHSVMCMVAGGEGGGGGVHLPNVPNVPNLPRSRPCSLYHQDEVTVLLASSGAAAGRYATGDLLHQAQTW
jgi:hypothetical protein